MARTSVARLLVTVVAAGAVSSLLLRVVEGRGGTVAPVPWAACAVLLLIAAVVVRLGWAVRQYARGRRPGTDPIVAARTLVLAKAAAWTGALVSGWYLGHVLLVLRDLEIAGRREVATSAGGALLCALLLAVAGVLAERWCEIRDEDDDESPGPGASPAADGVL